MKLQIGSIIVLVLLSAFFSACETAFTSLSFLQIRSLETKGKKSSALAASLAKNPDLLLTTILIGNNIANLSAAAITTALAINVWGNNSIGIATGILTFLILLFGEITPKQMAINHNIFFASLAAYPIRVFSVLLFPAVGVIKFISSGITNLFTPKEKRNLSLESLMHVVDVAETEGIVDEYETSLFQKVLHFSEAPVKSIMTHRTELFSLPSTMPLAEAYPQIFKSGYSRIPVYEESPENIVGILLLRDILGDNLENHCEKTVADFIREPIFVPQSRKLNDMALQFQQEQLQIAVVLDEYGGLSGIVTMEDIVEQLFGEIYDEHEIENAMRINQEAKNIFLIKGDTTMQEIKDELDLEIERSDLSCTLAAFLMEHLGTIPTPGESISFSFGSFSIASMKGKRIETARLHLSVPESEN